MSLPGTTRNGTVRTSAPRRMSETWRIRFRLKRSTNTPANSPTNRVGTAVTISVMPTLSAEFVTRKTKIAAARSVSEDPMVETSWAVQSAANWRFRNTENMDGAGVVADTVDLQAGR